MPDPSRMRTYAAFFAVGGFLAAAIAGVSLLGLALQGLTPLRVADFLVSLVLAVSMLAAWRLLKRGRFSAAYVFGGGVLLALALAQLLGRGLNLALLLVGVLVVWQMWGFRQRGDLD